ncbi:MAG TPA: hypothetical protein VH643_05565, partial [Gemmataceae bacterium]
ACSRFMGATIGGHSTMTDSDKQYSLDVMSPGDVSTVLRVVADKYRESQLELAGAWQDKHAGKIWSKIARILERAADSVDRAIAKEGK